MKSQESDTRRAFRHRTMQSRARGALYRPDMSSEITHSVSRCSTATCLETELNNETYCNRYHRQQKPGLELELILFKVKGKYYPLFVDYHINYPEFSLLPDTTCNSHCNHAQ